MSFESWYAENEKSNSEVSRVSLLKLIETATAQEYETNILDKMEDEKVKTSVRKVVLESNMAGIEEFGELWFTCIRSKMERMSLCTDWILGAMKLAEVTNDDSGSGVHPTGFDAFERALIAGGCNTSREYNQYYLDYLSAVQNKEVNDFLKANPPPSTDLEVYSPYTILTLTEDKLNLQAVPFSKYFEKTLVPVLASIDAWIADCEAAISSNTVLVDSNGWTSELRANYVAYLKHYRYCLALDANAQVLEEEWMELDRKWMDTKGPIQVVHDIETGYGDPLRVKATPDISLRFLDDSFNKENVAIADIQNRMMGYFEGRGTELSQQGITALKNTMAGLYFIPFKTGISLQFSFSGQSIPNRVSVKEEKGVKIYFDPVETAARMRINGSLVRGCYTDADAVFAKFTPPVAEEWAAETLCWHIAAHEVGHAIYNLGAVTDVFSSPANESLLEEPRAELTAMFTLKLLYDQQVLDEEALSRALVHFALDALRYFDKYDSEALRPYIIFMVYSYKVYEKHGFLSIDAASNKMKIDETKTMAVLDDFCDCYLRLLNAMDTKNGSELESILFVEMAPENSFVRHLLHLLKASKEQDGSIATLSQRPERNCTCHPSWSLPMCMECK